MRRLWAAYPAGNPNPPQHGTALLTPPPPPAECLATVLRKFRSPLDLDLSSFYPYWVALHAGGRLVNEGEIGTKLTYLLHEVVVIITIYGHMCYN